MRKLSSMDKKFNNTLCSRWALLEMPLITIIAIALVVGFTAFAEVMQMIMGDTYQYQRVVDFFIKSVIVFPIAALFFTLATCKNLYEIKGNYLLVKEYSILGCYLDMELNLNQVTQVSLYQPYRWLGLHMFETVEVRANGQTYRFRAYSNYKQLHEAISQYIIKNESVQ